LKLLRDGITIIPLATPQEINVKRIGILGTKGKILKALMEEKQLEKEVINSFIHTPQNKLDKLNQGSVS
jgi:hypothetical protein